MVLLKNEDVLPLDPKTCGTVFVTGPAADDVTPMISRYGPGTSDVITPLAGIKAFLGEKTKVIHSEGVAYYDETFPGSGILPQPPNEAEQAKLDKAIEAAKSADVIIAVMGDSEDTVGESRSRTDLNLPGHQNLLVQEMVKTGKPVIVVLMIGRAASINWIDRNADGILVCWHAGEKVGQAVAETLFGANSPGGKLPITFPKTVGQIPLAVPHRNGAWAKQEARHDPNGWGTTRVLGPLYRFGYGLSYTTFDYQNFKISSKESDANTEITVTCEITNTGYYETTRLVYSFGMDAQTQIKPRKRSAAKHQAILVAAEAVAGEFGYAPSTIELIARRAGVGKQTIYRWWPSKAALYLETYKRLVSRVTMPGPEIECRRRLQRFLASLFRQYHRTSAGVILRGLIGDMVNDDDVRDTVQTGLLLERSSVLLDPIAAGVDTGQLGAGITAQDAADVVVALIWKQLLVDPEKLDARFAKHVVNVALRE